MDFDAMRHLILPGTETGLLDRRQEEEAAVAQRQQAFRDQYKDGPPPLPDVQVVFSHERGTFGVAVRGAQFVCTLPKGYEKQGLELNALDGGMWCATFPGRSPLLLDPRTGNVRVM
jgi:hypothetical protein